MARHESLPLQRQRTQYRLGLDWYDYGFRWYDAELGRFPSVDPIIENFPDLTPYNYASNNPSTLIDLWGLQGVKNPLFESLDANNPTEYLNQALNLFALDFEQAKAATIANNGREYGYGIFVDNDGNLERTDMIEGAGADNVVNIAGYILDVRYDDINDSRVSNKISNNKTSWTPELYLVGIYHTHPDMGEDEDPISIGDARALLETAKRGTLNYGGFAFGTGFFAIADDINGGRYAFVVEDINTAADAATLLYPDFQGNNPIADGEVNNMEGETTGERYRTYFPTKFFGSGIGLYYNTDNSALLLNREERGNQRIIRN